MAKKIKCRVILHGSCREIHGGFYDSKAEAKRSVIYWNRPYTIVPITKPTNTN